MSFNNPKVKAVQEVAASFGEELLAVIQPTLPAGPSVTVSVPSGCQAIAVLGQSAIFPTTVEGQTTGQAYPVRMCPEYYSTPRFSRAVALVDATVDPVIRVFVGDITAPAYVVALFGTQAVAAFLDSEGVSGDELPLQSMQVAGSDGTHLRTLSTDASGRLVPALAVDAFNRLLLPPASTSAGTGITLGSGTPSASIAASSGQLIRAASLTISVETVTAPGNIRVIDTGRGDILATVSVATPGNVPVPPICQTAPYQLEGELELEQTNGNLAGVANLSANW